MLGAIVGNAVIGGLTSYLGGDAEAKAAQEAQKAYNAQYQQGRADLAPYRNIGSQAINALGGIYGYAPLNPNQNINGSPFSRDEFNKLSNVWGDIRNAANYGDINWAAHGGDPGLSDASKDMLSSNWGAVRGAANLGDINWLASAGYTPPPPTMQEGTGAGPDYSAFYQSPDYQFRKNEGMNNIQNAFAARGGAASGNALRALAEFNSNLAASEFGNYFNRQLGLAGQGQNAATNTASMGMQNAGQVGNALMAQGGARASGIRGIGDAAQSGMYDYVYSKNRGWV